MKNTSRHLGPDLGALGLSMLRKVPSRESKNQNVHRNRINQDLSNVSVRVGLVEISENDQALQEVVVCVTCKNVSE